MCGGVAGRRAAERTQIEAVRPEPARLGPVDGRTALIQVRRAGWAFVPAGLIGPPARKEEVRALAAQVAQGWCQEHRESRGGAGPAAWPAARAVSTQVGDEDRGPGRQEPAHA